MVLGVYYPGQAYPSRAPAYDPAVVGGTISRLYLVGSYSPSLALYGVYVPSVTVQGVYSPSLTFVGRED